MQVEATGKRIDETRSGESNSLSHSLSSQHVLLYVLLAEKYDRVPLVKVRDDEVLSCSGSAFESQCLDSTLLASRCLQTLEI